MNTQQKPCFKCGKTKPIHDFYKHHGMADGHLNKCKECARRDVRKNRLKRLEYYQEFDRKRGDLPHRVAARSAYSQTEQGRARHRAARTAYMDRNPERRAAHNAVSNALRDGSLWKSPCCMSPGCFSTDRIHGHHTHYENPLSVVWLCTPCHIQLHSEFDQKRRQERAKDKS